MNASNIRTKVFTLFTARRILYYVIAILSMKIPNLFNGRFAQIKNTYLSVISILFTVFITHVIQEVEVVDIP